MDAIPKDKRAARSKRFKRRKSRKFKGKKERLREEIKTLQAEKESCTQRNYELSLQNRHLKRNISQTKLVNTVTHSVRKSSCRTKATGPIPSCSSVKKYTLAGVRQFSQSEIVIMKSSELGQGRFGKCVLGIVGPMKVCIKLCKPEKDYEAYFNREVQMLSRCCHSNLPMLYGACIDGQKMIIMTLHGFDKDNSLSLHAAVCVKCNSIPIPEFSIHQWKNILCGIISAVHYLHEKKILHNDIKGDNIVIDKQNSDVRSVLVDLGKACYIHEGRRYSLSSAEKRRYVSNHPQIAPEVRDGHSKQSKESDIYSVGRIIDIVNRHKLAIPVLNTMSQNCLQYQSTNRPSSTDLFTSLTFLLK